MLAFNTAYWHHAPATAERSLVHQQSFYFPLDTIRHWNRMYGPRGFLQWQCVVPTQAAETVMATILSRIAKSRLGSFLAVFKQFGSIASPGMLSFPRQGATLALDFPNTGSSLEQLLTELDDIVMDCGGAIYPAKDARMTAATFRRGFPQWESFSHYVDERFSSSFWRRVRST
jgi:FAD/FMN-containing dehydrogenase